MPASVSVERFATVELLNVGKVGFVNRWRSEAVRQIVPWKMIPERVEFLLVEVTSEGIGLIFDQASVR